MPESDEMHKEYTEIYVRFRRWRDKHAGKHTVLYDWVEDVEDAMAALSDELDALGGGAAPDAAP